MIDSAISVGENKCVPFKDAAPAADLHNDTLGHPGAEQVSGNSASQIVEKDAGNTEWERNHESSPTQD